MDQNKTSVNKKTEFARDIHGTLNFEKDGFKASLQKNVFNEGVYKDGNNNEVKFSKEFWTELLNDFRNSEPKIFFWLMEQYADTRNYKEEYKIDIFGAHQYKNNQGGKASLSTDNFGQKKYEDSKGNKTVYSTELWNRMLDRHETTNKVFMSLVHRNLLKK